MLQLSAVGKKVSAQNKGIGSIIPTLSALLLLATLSGSKTGKNS